MIEALKGYAPQRDFSPGLRGEGREAPQWGEKLKAQKLGSLRIGVGQEHLGRGSGQCTGLGLQDQLGELREEEKL